MHGITGVVVVSNIFFKVYFHPEQNWGKGFPILTYIHMLFLKMGWVEIIN